MSDDRLPAVIRTEVQPAGILPRFKPGDEGEIAGVHWRIRTGAKSDNDFVLEIRTDGWVKPKQSVAYLLCDAWAQVEDILYPMGTVSPNGHSTNEGRFKFYDRLVIAMRHGWEYAAGWTEREIERRRRREEGMTYDFATGQWAKR